MWSFVHSGARWAAMVAVSVSAVLLFAGCTGDGDVAARNRANCDRAFEEASTSEVDLDATIRRCLHWTDWIQGAQSHPDLLAGLAPTEVLEDRCFDPASGLAQYVTCATWAASDATPTPRPIVTVPPIRTPQPIARSQRSRSTPRPPAAANRRSEQSRDCTPGYSPCIPPASDVDCAGGNGNGPAYTRRGVVYRVTGNDPYKLDSDGDGRACERQR